VGGGGERERERERESTGGIKIRKVERKHTPSFLRVLMDKGVVVEAV